MYVNIYGGREEKCFSKTFYFSREFETFLEEFSSRVQRGMKIRNEKSRTLEKSKIFMLKHFSS